MPPFKDYRIESKARYGTEGENLTLNQINTGCMQRIADAVEIMVADRVKLERDLTYYKERCKSNQNTIEALRNKVIGMSGARTRYKNQIASLKAKLEKQSLIE